MQTVNDRTRAVTWRALTALIAVTSAVVVSAPARATPSTEVLVRLQDDVSPSELLPLLRQTGGRVDATFGKAVAGLAATLPAAAVDRLAADPRVEAVEPNHPIRAFQAPSGVRRIGADGYAPADIDGDGSTADVDVAVLDTGVAEHPDLNLAGSVDCLTGQCVTATPADPHSHGTHVAGSAAARDDGTGVVGVAPGARIHSVRVLGPDGSGSLSSLIAGLDWLRANADRIEVANISFGCECRSSILDEAVRSVADAGVTLVVAAGNAGTDAGSYSPASHPDVIAVAAISDYDGAPGRASAVGCMPDLDDTFASYSNYGAVVDVVAPGSCITSTMPNGGYARKTGTSMATPHVTGAAALHIVTADIPQSSSRPATVRNAITTEHAVAPADDCGYIDSVSVAPMLHLTCVGVPANAAPILDVTAPAGGTTIESGQTVQLRASARDQEDGDISAGIVWTSSVDGRLGTGGAIDATLTQVGEHTIVASVTDSSGDNTRTSRAVTVTSASGSTGSPPDEEPSVPQSPEPEAPPSTNKTPQLDIVAPVPEGRIVASLEAQLIARAVDAEDGDVRAFVTWHSNVDGDLGAGGSRSVALSAGNHRITASVTDTSGNEATRSVAVLVAAADELTPRPVTDGCPPDRVPDAGFRDVDGPFAPPINCIAWWDVTKGTGPDTYSPGQPVTRGQMASFVAAMIRRSGGTLPEPSTDHFEDDDGGAFEAAIDQLAAAGVVQGFSETTYAPARVVTRGQMATFLTRAYERRAATALPGIQPRFNDIGQPHAANIRAIASAGITAGVAGGDYEPATVVSRAQMAAFVARTLDLLVDTGISTPPS